MRATSSRLNASLMAMAHARIADRKASSASSARMYPRTLTGFLGLPSMPVWEPDLKPRINFLPLGDLRWDDRGSTAPGACEGGVPAKGRRHQARHRSPRRGGRRLRRDQRLASSIPSSNHHRHTAATPRARRRRLCCRRQLSSTQSAPPPCLSPCRPTPPCKHLN